MKLCETMSWSQVFFLSVDSMIHCCHLEGTTFREALLFQFNSVNSCIQIVLHLSSRQIKKANNCCKTVNADILICLEHL